MLSSSQVAAMMAQQNQAFMGMQQYSQVISAQMPQPYGGIGSYGSQNPIAPQFAQAPGAARQHAGFSYGGGNAFGYGMGNSAGAMGVAAMGGAGNFALGGLGIAGGLGLMGRAGMAFDPLGAGMAGFGAARAMGMGVGGALGMGAMAGGMVAAPMMMAQHALGSMVTGAQEQAGVNQALGQFSFSNPMSRSGKGFSRQDAMAIGSMTRELQALPEMMTSMSELTRIMDKLGQSGMMQGVRDAGEFGKKFKDTIHTLKDISKMMGSSMEEALHAFQESKQAGIYSPGAIKQNIMQRQIVGGLTGMNQQQVNQLQQYGANSSWQAGGSRAGGAKSITRVAGELGMAQQMGLLSDDKVMEMTGGVGGAEGLQQLAGSMNDVGQRLGRSSLGTAMTLAMGEVKDGKYTGNMDQEMVQRVRNGQLGKSELLRMAHEKSRGRGAKISFAAHRQRLTTEMVNSAGAQGVAMELSTILGERGFDNPDALNLVMQRYGVGEREAGQVIELMKEMPGIQRGMGEAGMNASRQMAEQAFMKENASFEGIKRKIGKKMENVLTEPFKKMGASIANSISESVDSFVDDIFGRYTTKVTAMAGDTLLSANMGNKKAMSLVAGARGSSKGLGGNDLRATGVGGFINSMSDQTSTGDAQTAILKTMGSAYYGESHVSRPGDIAGLRKQGKDVLNYSGDSWGSGSWGGTVGTTTAGQRANAARDLSAANAYEGMIDITKGVGKTAANALRYQLSTNDDIKEDGSNQEKMSALREGLNNTAGNKDLISKVRASNPKLANASDIDIMDALAKATGKGKQTRMFTRSGLAKELTRFGGSDKELADSIDKTIKSVSGRFDGQEALARSVLSDGGDAAKLVSAGLSGGQMGSDVQNALGSSEGPSAELLSSLGMTRKQFEAAKGQSNDLVRAGIKGGVNGADMRKIQSGQLEVAMRRNEAHEKEIGYGLSDRVHDADAAGLTDGGRGMLGRLSKYADSLSSGKGLGERGGETAGLVESLAEYKGKDKGKLLGIAGVEIASGVQMIHDTNQAYRRSKKDKGGGKSVDDMIERLGLTGEAAKEVRTLAGDKGVDKSEEKNIEKYLGEIRTKSVASSKGAEGGVAGAAKNLSDTLEKMSKNQDLIAATLANLVNKSGTVEKKP